MIWAKHIASQKLYTDIAVKNNNVYLCGSFNQTVDFDPGSGTANLSVGSAYSWFFAKYDSAGNYVYAKYLNNSSGTSNLIYGGNGIAIDDNENTYLFGNFTTTVDFDPGAGTANLTASLSTAMYLAKYDATGNYLWAKNLDIDGSSAGYISFDNSGNILLTGNYFSTGDFDPNAGIAIQNTVPTGVHNMFLAKYDVNGNYIAATSFGGYLQDYAAGMAVDDADNIYLSGTMLSDTCDFEPGAGELLLTKSSSGIMFNVFYAKYGPLFPSAIDETESLPFKIYPNPSSGKFVVELNLTSSAPFQITDITGKKITEGIFSAQKNEIDLSNAANGVYFLKINSVTIKLMKH